MPFCKNIKFSKNLIEKKKKKDMTLVEKLKHVEIEMIKVKPVITSVTKVLSYMLTICLTKLCFHRL